VAASESIVRAGSGALMKLLYTDTHLHALNSTNTLMPTVAAAAASEISFYGPGYSSDADLELGIAAYVRRHGPYDGIVLGPNFPFFGRDYDDERLLKGALNQQRYNALISSIPKRLAYYRDVFATLPDLPIKWRFGCLLTFDWYCATAAHADAIEALDLHVIAPDAGFAAKLEELPDWAWQERHFIRKRKLITGEWHALLTRRAERVVSLHHFIGENEFFFRGLSERRYRISVPGVNYVKRESALRELRRRRIKTGHKLVFYGYQLANRFRLPAFSRFLPLKMFNVAFQGNLADSRFVFTAPEGSGIPVRKFFEIPAAGAVMLCMPPANFSALGFKDGEHYVAVEPESLPDVLLDLERNGDQVQAIATKGRQLVFERHSLRARARQFADCLAAMAAGTFAGSRWEEGEFKVVPRYPARNAQAAL
jgi:hypothetical protein